MSGADGVEFINVIRNKESSLFEILQQFLIFRIFRIAVSFRQR
jgi:hypothetical protein